MVLLWPWRGDDTSPASFERTLSLLSNKISKSGTQLDALHQRSRRLKALWTLYTSFAYILYSIVLTLVLGRRNWGATEYGGIIGGPLLIFLVRMLLTAYYNYRISNVTSRLQDLHKEREATIGRLKAATKYDSTQQLLEKYGSTPHKMPQTSSPPGETQNPGARGLGEKPDSQSQRRLPLAPPATANIPRNPPTPQREPLGSNLPRKGGPSQYRDSPPTATRPRHTPLDPGPPEFAPNAFPVPSQTAAGHLDEPKWYDRILDLLLGEDETLPRNRLALVCTHCRLVNGQAPPGIRRLEDLGKWRCGGCQGWNGTEDETKKLIAEARGQEESNITEKGGSAHAGSEDPEEAQSDAEDAVPAPAGGGNTSEGQGNPEKGDSTVQNDESDDESKLPPPPKPKGRPKGSRRKKE